MTRVTIPLGEDIGFLPGTEEEKMEPWMGALMDNLEVLTQSQEGGTGAAPRPTTCCATRIKIRSLNFMRGRTFLNRYIILDEAQNLTPKQMKALITRAGPGTKLVCLGNIAQIDTPYLSETTSGLTYVVNRFRGWPHYGHVTLARGERSRLADFAVGYPLTRNPSATGVQTEMSIRSVRRWFARLAATLGLSGVLPVRCAAERRRNSCRRWARRAAQRSASTTSTASDAW